MDESPVLTLWELKLEKDGLVNKSHHESKGRALIRLKKAGVGKITRVTLSDFGEAIFMDTRITLKEVKIDPTKAE